MNRSVLPAGEIPNTFYLIQPARYYVPKCADTKKGIYALCSVPAEPKTEKELLAEVDNHQSIVVKGSYLGEPQWPPPFISVYPALVDAEEAMKNGNVKLFGDKQLVCIEISGAVIRSRRVKVLRAKDVRGIIAPQKNQYFIWHMIPLEAIINRKLLTIHGGKTISLFLCVCETALIFT